jgi:aryl-alcohol dehydrogenase-like predicted oxidoreductase
MPAIGLGTFGSDHVTAAQVAHAVKGAAAAGYRHFDCASVYGNEKEIGAALSEIIAGGVSRRDLWITSKLWNDKHAEADVIPTFEQSLSDLQLDYSRISIRRVATSPFAAIPQKPISTSTLWRHGASLRSWSTAASSATSGPRT